VRKVYLCIFSSLAAITATVPQAVMAQGLDGFFVNGAVGSSKTDANPFHNDAYNRFDDNSNAFDLNVGYRWDWFGVELGYFDPSDYHTTLKVPFSSQPDEAFARTGHVHGLTAGVNVHYDFAPHWYVSGRVGAYRWHGSEDNYSGFNDIGTGGPIFTHDTGSHTDWYAGAGVGYDFTQHFGIGVAYDRYKAVSHDDGIDLTSRMWSATAEYRF
jgi:OOP family OmpA-OmpF porin